jgi:hypothetical protein
MPLYSAGAQLKHFYPVSTLIDGQGLNMTVQSYNGNLDFGFVADRTLVPDLWLLTDLLQQSMDELVELADAAIAPLQPPTATTKNPAVKKAAATKAAAKPRKAKTTTAAMPVSRAKKSVSARSARS